MKIICIGRVRNGGPVELSAPAVPVDGTLEERIAAQIARNEEALAMNADLDAIRAGKPVGYRLTDADLEAMDEEAIGREIGTSPWRW